MNDGAAYGIDNMTYCEKGQYVKEHFIYILIIQTIRYSLDISHKHTNIYIFIIKAPAAIVE